MRAAYENISRFEKMSGLTLNVQKSRAMWIGKYRRRRGPEGLSYEFNWDNAPIEFLGVKIDPNSESRIADNYRSKTNSLKKKLSPWLR